MSGIQISRGLIYKLAGVKDPQKSQQQPSPSPPQIRLPSLVRGGDIAASFSPDHEFRQLLAQSKRVGSLLLKQEEKELQEIEKQAQALVEQHKSPVRPEPCQAEKAACLECYSADPQRSLTCGELVERYAACAKAAREELL